MSPYTLLVCLLIVPADLVAQADWREALNKVLDLEREGKFNEAKSLLLSSLAKVRLQPEEPEWGGMVLWRLGRVSHVLGDYEGGRVHYRAALPLLTRALGADHPTVALAMDSYALLCVSRKELKEAHRLRMDALSILEAKLGPDHPDTLAVRSNIASGLFAVRDYAGAELILREVLERWPSDSKESTRAGQIWASLGHVLLERKQIRSAEGAFQRSLRITLNAAGTDSVFQVNARIGLALTLIELDQPLQADECLERAQVLATRILGPVHPMAIRIFGIRSEILRSLGRKSEAKELEYLAKMGKEAMAKRRLSISFAELAPKR